MKLSGGRRRYVTTFSLATCRQRGRDWAERHCTSLRCNIGVSATQGATAARKPPVILSLDYVLVICMYCTTSLKYLSSFCGEASLETPLKVKKKNYSELRLRTSALKLCVCPVCLQLPSTRLSSLLLFPTPVTFVANRNIHLYSICNDKSILALCVAVSVGVWVIWRS